MATVNGRVPGREARAGRFSGPSLIPSLNVIQREHGWLPREELVRLGRETRRPLYEIEGLISFYPHFRLEPPPRVVVTVCRDLSCWLHGSEEQIVSIRDRFDGDVEVELRQVSCVGCCDLAPAATVQERPVRTSELPGAVEQARANGQPPSARTPGRRRVRPNDPYAEASNDAGYATVRAMIAGELLAGMLTIGAEQGWVFIRHEYGAQEAAIRAELDAARAAGILGPDVLGSGRRLDIDVFTSPGGYILGEESALIECMEGHRGEPRNKPPFPGVNGLWGQPTLMNSVETFAAVPIILQRGAQWWKAQGVNGGTGLKFFAISGHIARPDVYCVPMGTTARELIELAGGLPDGAELQAFQPGGASSNFLGPDQLDVPLDFRPLADAGSMLGSGAVVVIGDQTDLLAAATNVLRFFRNESCGNACRAAAIWCHGLAIKPGKPTLLAHRDGIPIIGLPGNPRTALVVFRLIGMPLVRRVGGGWTVEPRVGTVRARLSRDLPSAAGRLDVVQVRLRDAQAEPIFGPSALLSVMTAADGYLIVAEDANGLPGGELVDVFLYA